MMRRRMGLAALAALAGGCATAPVETPEPAAVPRDWLAEISAEAARVPSAVDVVPLPDPALADLVQRAHVARAARDLDSAETALRQALGIAPEDPAVWQSLAELEIARGRWVEAEQAAQRSLDLGSRVGALCVRNGLTIFASRVERGDAIGAADARAAVEDCVVDAPARF
jgi:predicted Zn-dependent protease